MKTIYFMLLSTCFCSFALAQELRTNFSEENQTYGGDVHLKSSYARIIEAGTIAKTFEIECLEDGAYYMDAWILPPSTDEGFPEYKVEINGLLSESSFKPRISDWQSLALTDTENAAATVKLRKGTNKVSVIGKNVGLPLVDFIKLSLNPLNAGFSDKDYRDFKEKIRTNTLYEDQEARKLQAGVNNSDMNGVHLRGTAGEIYDYEINREIYFTTYVPLCCYAGDNVVITTTQSGSFGHVIEFFQTDNSDVSFSYAVQSSGNGTLSCTIPAYGWYALRLRSSAPGTSGAVNISCTGISYMSPLSLPGSQVTYCEIPITASYGTAYYFTCKAKKGGNTLLFLADASSPKKVVAQNDDGGTINGYSWENNSFIKTSKSVNAAFISAPWSILPYFQCDVYLGLKSTSVTPSGSFRYLPADNSFISGSLSSSYQCFDWSVGSLSSLDITPYLSISDLSLWDDFYANPLNDGYSCYTRLGADSSNAAIALWVLNGQISHASVRKNSTIPKPHGFEWESKCGGYERIMHTRDAVAPSYGAIFFYYKPCTGWINYSIPIYGNQDNISNRSINKQPLIFDRDKNNQFVFKQSDLDKIAALIDLIPEKITEVFQRKYLSWVKTWSRPEINIHSNPNFYAESYEYDDLVEFCLRYDKAIWPLVIDKFAHPVGMYILDVNLLRDLTYRRGIDVDIWGDIQRPYFKAGIWKSTYSCFVDYCCKLIADEYDNIMKTIQDITILENEEIETIFISVYNQNIFIKIQSEIAEFASIKLFNLNGSFVYDSSFLVTKGEQSFAIDASKLNKGIYIIEIINGGTTKTQRISI